MKQCLLFTCLICLIVSHAALGQEGISNIGVGIGNSGVALKLNPEKTFAFTGRLGLGSGYSLESYDLSLKLTANGLVNAIKSSDYRLYFGLGLDFFYRQNFRADDDVLNALLEFHSPLGIELFPFEQKNISITVESVIRFSRNATLNENLAGIIEFSYYFNKKD